MKGRIRWAMFTALLSVVLAVALGVAALTYGDEETVVATPAGPIEGNYVLAATTLNLAVASITAGGTDVSVTGGRLSIGGDSHAFWSVTMHARDASKTGRLSCEGTLDRDKRGIVVAPRYGYTGFAPDLDRRDIETTISNLFCNGAGLEGVDTRPVEVIQDGPVLILKGRGGSITWRRE